MELRKKKKSRRSNTKRMHRLRLKFVEQAKQYLGVPYARKYFEPGSKKKINSLSTKDNVQFV